MKPEDDKEFGLGCCENCGSNGQSAPIKEGSDYCDYCLENMKQMTQLKELTFRRNLLNEEIAKLKKVSLKKLN